LVLSEYTSSENILVLQLTPFLAILCLKQSHCPAPEYVNYLWVSELQAKEYKCQMEKVMWDQNSTWRR
jgi:hypothetical protein